MTVTSQGTPTQEAQLEEFYDRMRSAELQPLWTQGRALQPLQPAPSMVPWLWRGEAMRALAADAGRLIGIDMGGDRRALSLANPGLGGLPFATSTLWGAIQYLGPRESAPAHRHSQGALRFVLEGSGTWTTVNGDACDMYPGDLVLTPSWTWHDHNNNADSPMVWFDGLDLPLVNMLEAPFYERYPSFDVQPVAGHNLSETAFSGDDSAGFADVARPPGDEEAFSPMFVYRFERTDRELDRRLASSPDGAVELDFVSPVTGRAPLPTLGCHMTRISGGSRTKARRKVGSSIYVVRAGAGVSVVGGVEMEWKAGDIFVSPSWAAVEHRATVTADLFAVSDRPALEALRLYREESLAEPQPVTEHFGGD